ncbi:MAG TPA: hypothetical protein VKE69_00445, partial [Planctomycetota bacterium]|nr:hypothetical protein [Planctomycetota bacterium]
QVRVRTILPENAGERVFSVWATDATGAILGAVRPDESSSPPFAFEVPERAGKISVHARTVSLSGETPIEVGADPPGEVIVKLSETKPAAK